MYRKLLKAKIHRAVVTDADLHYEGSLTVDAALLDAAGIREFELVQVVDVENGARLETYTIAGPAGSGVIRANGAAARLLNPGDHVIIMTYALVPEPLPEAWSPTIVLLDDANRIREIRGAGENSHN
ncbi:MAG: aspartate 1-decarboxylase [Chloroflexi bacterium]|nr:aspartate 1-decarboxylase [Chloroflexota bacterium]